MGKLTGQQVDSIMRPIMGAKALILDLRNYPKGTLWQVAQYLTDKPDTFVHFTSPIFDFPACFIGLVNRHCRQRENSEYIRARYLY